MKLISLNIKSIKTQHLRKFEIANLNKKGKLKNDELIYTYLYIFY